MLIKTLEFVTDVLVKLLLWPSTCLNVELAAAKIAKEYHILQNLAYRVSIRMTLKILANHVNLENSHIKVCTDGGMSKEIQPISIPSPDLPLRLSESSSQMPIFHQATYHLTCMVQQDVGAFYKDSSMSLQNAIPYNKHFICTDRTRCQDTTRTEVSSI